MRLVNLLNRRGTATVACERLQGLLLHERTTRLPDLLAILRVEILAAITEYVSEEMGNVQIRVERGSTASLIGVSVEIPHSAPILFPSKFDAGTGPARG